MIYVSEYNNLNNNDLSCYIHLHKEVKTMYNSPIIEEVVDERINEQLALITQMS